MLSHVKCAWLTPGEERKVAIPACRDCALSGRNPCAYPLPVILLATTERKPDVVRVSSTMFESCAREQALKIHEDWGANPERMYTRAIGSLVHLGAEVQVGQMGEAALGRVEVERRYARPYVLPDGRTATVTAALDALYTLPDGTYAIADYKTTDSLGTASLTKKIASYNTQFSLQRWILAGYGKEVSLVDLYFLMQKKRRKVNLFPDGDAEIPSAQLMSLEEVEHYLDEKLPTLFDGVEGITLPGPLEDSSSFWKCFNCDVQEICRARHHEQCGVDIPAFGTGIKRR